MEIYIYLILMVRGCCRCAAGLWILRGVPAKVQECERVAVLHRHLRLLVAGGDCRGQGLLCPRGSVPRDQDHRANSDPGEEAGGATRGTHV